MNIAIYSRKSKFTGKGVSVENQIIHCKNFINFKFDINPDEVEVYIDEGFTGRNENRPRYQEMMNKVKNGEIKHIVLYQLNRLGRNARDIHNSMQYCVDMDCIIYSANEGFDSSTSFGRAVIGIMASLAQLETEQLAERVKDNMYTLAKMGRWLGGQSPLGFDGTREFYFDEAGKQRSYTILNKNNEEIRLVKEIFEKYIEVKSISQVSKWALSNCLKGKNGGNLDKSAINTILQNPVYVKSTQAIFDFLESKGFEVCGEPNGNGLLRYGKDSIAAVGKHKGVIDAERWLLVQDILKKNTTKAPALGKTHTAMLTGILKCGCGSGMRVTYGHTNKEGNKPFYYTCSMKNNSGGTRCNSKNINGQMLEKKFIEFLKLYNTKYLKNMLEANINNNLKKNNLILINRIDDEIQKSNKSIKQLLDKLKLIEDIDVSKLILDEITQEKNNIKELDDKKNNLIKEQSSTLISQNEIQSILDELDDFNKAFDFLTLEQKQVKIRELIHCIVYKDGKFEVEFNFNKQLTDTSQIGTSYRGHSNRYPCWS